MHKDRSRATHLLVGLIEESEFRELLDEVYFYAFDEVYFYAL
jgi:hypothetical protein